MASFEGIACKTLQEEMINEIHQKICRLLASHKILFLSTVFYKELK